MTLQAKLQLGKILFVKCFTTFSKAKLSLANCLSRETSGTPPLPTYTAGDHESSSQREHPIFGGLSFYRPIWGKFEFHEQFTNHRTRINSLQTHSRGSNSYQKTRSYLDKWLLCERCVYHLQKWKQAFFVISLKKFFFLFCTSIAIIPFNLHYSMSHKRSLI